MEELRQQSVEELRKALREAEAREMRDQEARKAATPVEWRYTISPHAPRGGFEKVYDPSCRLYQLRGQVTNREEAQAAGHAEHEMRNGSGTYVYNTLSKMIVCSVGGGTYYVMEHTGNDDSDEVAMRAISRFLEEHPGGGDITEIVAVHRASKRNKA